MKKQIVIVVSLLLFGFVQAQKSGQSDSYIHLNMGVGSQSFQYSLVNGIEKGQQGYTLDVGYSHFFSREWGLSLGLGVQRFVTSSSLNYASVMPNQVDVAGDTYEFRANYKNWQEKQHGVFLDIPLAVQYRHFLSGRFGFLASAGAKVSIPVRSGYKAVGGEIVTTGYYSKWNALLHDLPRYGFSTYSGPYNGELSLKPSYSGIFDLGALYKVSPKLDVYLGGYLNYGLNSIVRNVSKPVYEPDGTYNGFLGSDQIKKVIPIAFGIKAGLYWKVKERKSAVRLDNEFSEVVYQTPDTKIPSSKGLDTQVSDLTQNIKIDNKQAVKPDTAQLVKLVPNVVEQANRIARSLNLKFDFNTTIHDFHIELPKINALAELLKANPDLNLLIMGHTCDIGTEANNLELGFRRALFVKQLLISRGVPAGQVKAASKGLYDPLVPNSTEENRSTNRRVEILAYKQEE